MKTINLSLVIGICLIVSGCGTMQHWYRVGMIEAHGALDDYYGDSSTNAPPSTNSLPSISLPGSTKPVACGCDLTKGFGIPLCPELGATDSEVDAHLYADWKAGIENGCGGLERDVRPLLARPQGGTFGYKYILMDRAPGGPRIEFNGDMMTVYCGVWHGERYHAIGKSDKEWDGGKIPPDFEAITPGTATLQKHFLTFRKVNQ